MTLYSASIGTIAGALFAWSAVQVVLCLDSLLHGNCPPGAERKHLIGAAVINGALSALVAWLVLAWATTDAQIVAGILAATFGIAAHASANLQAPAARN